MAEVLSQSQIDALLSAVRSGEKELDAKPESTEKKYRRYDFASPRKFTKDRIKMLTGIFENYSRSINSRLSARLRTNCEISVESVEEQRYYEFSNALGEGDVLALLNTKVNGKQEETPVMVYLSTQTALSMMDRMMGGEDTATANVGSDYTYTDLELRLYEDLIRELVDVMGNSWANYLPIEFSLRKTDATPTLSQIIGLDEIVVIADLQLTFSSVSGRMSIILPGDILSNIFAEITRENPIRRAALENKAEDIFDNLRDSSLEIIAQLGNTQLSLSDIYHLHVGDVIDLGCSKDSFIHLDIGGQHWFAGRVGTHDKNMAVRIDELCNPTEQRSE